MATQNDVARARREGELFGIPLGDLGWFQSLLMGLATGMAAFFLTTFVAIFAFLAYAMVSGKPLGGIPIQNAYRLVGFPIGVAVMASALGYLGFNWTRRTLRKRRAA